MHGVDISIQHYEVGEGGSRGSPAEESATDDVKAYVQDKSASTSLSELLGQEMSIDIVFTVLADDVDEDLRDGGHDAASTVTYHGRSYVVEHAEDEGGATITLHCSTREDS
ncbi:hypothetical protein C500_21180 [Natrialba magadii ATCC 43099]|nr:hypothetical protein C500_21180 [Natrialba magadii ATCC 43099]